MARRMSTKAGLQYTLDATPGVMAGTATYRVRAEGKDIGMVFKSSTDSFADVKRRAEGLLRDATAAANAKAGEVDYLKTPTAALMREEAQALAARAGRLLALLETSERLDHTRGAQSFARDAHDNLQRLVAALMPRSSPCWKCGSHLHWPEFCR